MLRLKGETRAEYFHVLCEACGGAVVLSNLRWVGGVPQVEARCDKCEEDDLKLLPTTWAGVTEGAAT